MNDETKFSDPSVSGRRLFYLPMNRLRLHSILIFSAILLGTLFQATAAGELRETDNFNREWKFQLGDVNGRGRRRV